jgi:hypothetical protein
MPTRSNAIARHAALVLPLAVFAAGCGAAAPSAPVPVVDLIKEFERADGRPAGAYVVADRLVAGTALPALVGPAPGRLTWTLALPRHGAFRARLAAAAAPLRVRIGVSDARIYEQLAELEVQPGTGWSVIDADLSAYAGWKFSLFYRPERRAWRLNLSADALSGVPATVAWGQPQIFAPGGADALEYANRKAQPIRSEAP